MLKITPNILTKHFRITLQVLCFFFLCFLIAAATSIYNAPEDYLQGIYAKIMYIHVPSAWLAMGLYSTLAFMSLGFIVFKNPFYFSIAKAIAPVGCGFALITLTTGSIWGKPTWGTWWVWDARLTSMLILFFIYSGYISLTKSIRDEQQNALVCSVFAMFGFINIPIIKFSVEIWNTLHQPASVFKLSGPSIHTDMLIPLLLSAACLLVFSCILVMLRIRIEYWQKKSNRLRYLLGKEIYS
jgi:heme exporter protein C